MLLSCKPAARTVSRRWDFRDGGAGVVRGRMEVWNLKGEEACAVVFLHKVCVFVCVCVCVCV